MGLSGRRSRAIHGKTLSSQTDKEKRPNLTEGAFCLVGWGESNKSARISKTGVIV